MRGRTHHHNTPHHEGGNTPTQHAAPYGGPHTTTAHNATQDNRSHPDAARPTMRGATHQRSTPHHEGGQTPPQHTTGTQGNGTQQHNAARLTMRGTTHHHNTPHHEGGHTPTQHAPPFGGPHTNAARPTIRGPHTEHNVTQHHMPHPNAPRPTMRGATPSRHMPHQ